MTGPVDAYLRRCDPAGDASLLRCVRRAEEASDAAPARRCLARPMFHDAAEFAALTADVTALGTLLEDVGERCFGGSAGYLAAQGVDADMIELILAGRTGRTSANVRADVFVADGRARIIELNRGSGLGGFDICRMNAALLAVPEFADFAREHGLDHVDTLALFAEQLRAAGAEVSGGRTPTVALVEESGAGTTAGGTCARLCASLRSRGLDVVHGELADLSMAGGRVGLGGRRVDVVFRYFFAIHLLASPTDRAVMDRLVRADRDGAVVLFPALDTDVCERKSALALLRTPAVWATLTADERALVTRRLPWTRLLGSDFPHVSARERADLVEECRARRTDLVLKPADGRGGVGLVFGAETTDARWHALLESEAIRNHLVQDRVTPDGEWIADADTGRVAPWHVIWGVYVLDGRYAGTNVRGRPASDGGVIGGRGNPFSPGCAFSSGQGPVVSRSVERSPSAAMSPAQNSSR
ncbi:MAG TPA: hypothetical protein VGN37_20975 [Actinocatenispora sp.]